jgi:hypothetical protein
MPAGLPALLQSFLQTACAGSGEQVPIPYRGIAILFVCSSILQKNGSAKHPRSSSSRI